tara:strand:+ start:299 stop:5455 length:5157 start_codon:yes stop_codon:yes gene_type:complete
MLRNFRPILILAVLFAIGLVAGQAYAQTNAAADDANITATDTAGIRLTEGVANATNSGDIHTNTITTAGGAVTIGANGTASLINAATTNDADSGWLILTVGTNALTFADDIQSGTGVAAGIITLDIGNTDANTTTVFQGNITQTNGAAVVITAGDNSNTNTHALTVDSANDENLVLNATIDAGGAADTVTLDVANSSGDAGNSITFSGAVGASSQLDVLHIGSTAHDVTVVFSAAADAAAIVIGETDGASATVTFNDVIDASTIVLGNGTATNIDAIVVNFAVAADKTITGAITGTANDTATINITDTDNGTKDDAVTFASAVGASGNSIIEAINIGSSTLSGTADFNAAVVATTITITAGDATSNGEDSTMIASHDVTAAIVLDDSTGSSAILNADKTTDQTLTGAITAAADNEGTITISNAAASGVYATFASQIGAAGTEIGTINIASGTTAGAAEFDAAVHADTVNVGVAGDMTDSVTSHGDFDSTLNATTINVLGGTGSAAEAAHLEVDGVLTATTLNITSGTNHNDSDALVTAKAGVTVTTINMNDTNADRISSLTITNSAAATVTSNIDGVGAAEGTVNVTGGTNLVTFTGKVGDSAGDGIKALNVGITATAGAAKFEGTVDATTITVDGEAGATTADFDEVVIGTLNINTGGTDGDTAAVTFAGSTFTGNVVLDEQAGNNAPTLTFDGTTQALTGDIDGQAAGDGAIILGATSVVTINGDVGNKATAIGDIQIPVGATLNVIAVANTDGIALDASESLNGRLSADGTAGARGGTISLVGEAGTGTDGNDDGNVSTIAGAVNMTAVNVVGGDGFTSASNAAGDNGGTSATTMAVTADITTYQVAGGIGQLGLANNANGDSGDGGAATGTNTGALTATTVNVAGGVGGAGGASTSAASGDGGAGGAATLDLNVATGTTQAITTLNISGGNGGDGGDSSSNGNAGGAAGVGGNALATIAGDFTGDINLNDGTDGSAGTGTSGGTGGAAGTGGTATVTFDGTTAQTITGSISAAADGEGTIVMTADSSATADIVTITGAVGSSSASIGTITSGVTTAQTGSKFDSDVYADTITHGLNQDWTGDNAMTMDFDGDVTFTTMTVTGGSANNGEDAIVTAAKNLTGTTINLNDGTNGNTILTLDGSTAQTVSANIVAGTAGAGTVNINNDATFTGTLAATNRLAALTVATDKTLTLSGAKTIGATAFNVNGAGGLTLTDTISLTASTTLDLSNGGTATLTLDPTTKFANDTVINADTGGATVNLSNNLTVIPPSNFTSGTLTLVDIDANDGTVNNNVANISITNNALATYAASAASGTADVIITATKASSASIASTLGVTGGAANAVSEAAGALSNVTSSTDQAILNAFNTAITAGGAQAKNAAQTVNVSEAAISSAGSAAVTATGQQVIAVGSTRMAALRTGKAFASAQASGFAGGNGNVDTAVWMKPFANWGDQDVRKGIAGFETETYGMAIGGDVKIDQSTVGASFSFSNTDVDSKGLDDAQNDIDSYQATIYADYTTDTYYIEGLIGFARNEIATSRTILLPGNNMTASATYDSNQYMVNIGAGMPIEVEKNHYITPSAQFQYTLVDNETYTESGAGALNLRVDQDQINVALGVLGMRYHTLNTGNNGTWTPELRAGITYDFAGDDGQSTSIFNGGGAAFQTTGADVVELGFRGGLGLSFTPAENHGLSVSANYDLWGKEDFVSHSANVSIRLDF